LSLPDKKLVEFKQIYVSEDDKDLYILDRANSRIIVFSKEGEYVGEYLAGQLSNASQFVVSEENKKIIFLENGKLFEIELRHI
jgi:hypothetical protein